MLTKAKFNIDQNQLVNQLEKLYYVYNFQYIGLVAYEYAMLNCLEYAM